MPGIPTGPQTDVLEENGQGVTSLQTSGSRWFYAEDEAPFVINTATDVAHDEAAVVLNGVSAGILDLAAEFDLNLELAGTIVSDTTVDLSGFNINGRPGQLTLPEWGGNTITFTGVKWETGSPPTDPGVGEVSIITFRKTSLNALPLGRWVNTT